MTRPQAQRLPEPRDSRRTRDAFDMAELPETDERLRRRRGGRTARSKILRIGRPKSELMRARDEAKGRRFINSDTP